jgi:hypothetical protein
MVPPGTPLPTAKHGAGSVAVRVAAAVVGAGAQQKLRAVEQSLVNPAVRNRAGCKTYKTIEILASDWK